jgi:hypothetical protein
MLTHRPLKSAKQSKIRKDFFPQKYFQVSTVYGGFFHIRKRIGVVGTGF